MAVRFEIPASRLADVQALVTRFARKADRLGFAALSVSVVDAFTRYWLVNRDGVAVTSGVDRVAPETSGRTERVWLRALDMVAVEVIGERPIIAGWQFVAVIEATPAGNMLRKALQI